MSTQHSVTAQDFKLISCQAVIFTPDEGVSVRKFLGGLAKTWEGRFDGDPLVLPVAETAPRDAPRVILPNRAGDWKCQLAPARLDVFWQKITPETLGLSVSKFFDETSTLLCEYRNHFDLRAARLAALVARYVPREAPGLFLAGHFCSPRWLKAPLNRPQSFELHARKVYALGETYKINSWVRSKTGVLPAENNQPIIVVEQDLNTLAEEAPERAFSDDQIRAFFTAASKELDDILRLYYPEETERS